MLTLNSNNLFGTSLPVLAPQVATATDVRDALANHYNQTARTPFSSAFEAPPCGQQAIDPAASAPHSEEEGGVQQVHAAASTACIRSQQRQALQTGAMADAYCGLQFLLLPDRLEDDDIEAQLPRVTEEKGSAEEAEALPSAFSVLRPLREGPFEKALDEAKAAMAERQLMARVPRSSSLFVRSSASSSQLVAAEEGLCMAISAPIDVSSAATRCGQSLLD